MKVSIFLIFTCSRNGLFQKNKIDVWKLLFLKKKTSSGQSSTPPGGRRNQLTLHWSSQLKSKFEFIFSPARERILSATRVHCCAQPAMRAWMHAWLKHARARRLVPQFFVKAIVGRSNSISFFGVGLVPSS